jgi:hypothetical protein
MHFRSMDRPPYLIGETVALPVPSATVAESVPNSSQENGIV